MVGEELTTIRRSRRARTNTAPSATRSDDSEEETSVAVKRNVMLQPSDTMQNALFESVASPNNSMQSTSSGWLGSYERDSGGALRELVNFVLKTAGCEFPIETHDMEQDNASGTLNEVQIAVISRGAGECLLTSRASQSKVLKSNFASFFEWLIENAANRDTLYLDESFMRRILSWIAVLTASNVRNFRYVAVVALFAMSEKLCELRENLRAQEEKNRKSIAASQKKSAKKSSLVDLEKKLKKDEEKRKALEEYFSKFETSVFANRRKDVDARIRAECIHALGRWMQVSPDTFVVTSYLKYLEFASSDENATVRSTSLDVLLSLINIDESMPMLTRFFKRFKARCVEIALHDVDSSVRRLAVELLVHGTEQARLVDEELSEVSSLIFDAEPRIRKATARLVLSHVEARLTEQWENELDEGDLEQQQEEHKNLQDTWPRFKLVSEILESQGSVSTNSNICSRVVAPHLNRNVLAAEAIYEVGKKEYSNWTWESIAKYLSADFAAIESQIHRASRKGDSATKAFLEAFVIKSPSTTSVLMDLLVGFITATLGSISRADKYGRRRQKDVSEAGTQLTHDDVYYKLTEYIPELDRAHGVTTGTAVRLLRLTSLIPTEAYRRLHKESSQRQLFKLAISQFTKNLSPPVLNECLQIFSIACTQDPFASEARSELRDVLENVTSSLTDLLSNPSPAPAQLIAPLARLDRLGECIDISACLASKLKQSSNSVVDRLLSLAETSGLDEDDQTYYKLLMSIFRSIFVWKLGSQISPSDYLLDDNAHDTRKKALDFVRSTIDQEWPMLKQSVASATLSTLLDVVVMAATVDKTIGTSELEFPTTMSDSSQIKIMQLYLAKELRYAELADVHLKEDPDLTGDVDEESTPKDDYGSFTASDADYDLCAFTAKIQLAAALGTVHPKYQKRLALNSRVLSPRYRALLKNGVMPAGIPVDYDLDEDGGNV